MWKLWTLPAAAVLAIVCGWTGLAQAAGVLRPSDPAAQPIEIVDHHVDVLINNGFARIEVRQTFHNPNDSALDAVYEFPVPPDAALSEMTIEVGDRVLNGEVVEREHAEQLYEEQAAAGNQVGLATQNSYQRFEFSVANVPADGDALMSFVYYEPVSIDTSVGRFLYPLENGGTDDASSFWTGNENTTTGTFSFDLTLKSAVPISEVRVPELTGAVIQDLGNGQHTVHFEAQAATLNEDVVVYYKLQDDTPGRLDVVPYRPASGGDGTFMLVLTPNIDLPAIEHGTDYVYVLDFSGSMDTKIATLRDAVAQALAELGPEDRFRLVGFSDAAFDITELLPVNESNLAQAIEALNAQPLLGGTNLYSGVSAGLASVDPERVTSVFLVTDGVANQGIVSPLEFDALLRESDVRVHGFLMGNSANWPLMDIISRASGGFYAAVSNKDDVIGQVLLAKSKLTHESLHSARLSLSGVEVSQTTDFNFGKVYRGQQLSVFGRYAAGGAAQLELLAKLRNQDKGYSLGFSFPDIDESSPELERLWALQMIHGLEQQALLGLLDPAEAARKVAELGIQYQLVTTETSMIVLDDAGFESAGIERLNQERTGIEQAAQASGQPAATSSYASGSSDDGEGNYGGALDPVTLGMFALALLSGVARRPARPKSVRRGSEHQSRQEDA